jgi:hypothetical protein
MFRILVAILSIGFASSALAIPCFFTLIKDSCWKDYNVTVSVFDVNDEHKPVVDIIVPTGSSWSRQKTECNAGQIFRYQAQFTPVFWQKDLGKKYDGLHFKRLPAKINPEDTAWNINICFPKDFSGAPLPPEAGLKCICDTSDIPDVEPQ